MLDKMTKQKTSSSKYAILWEHENLSYFYFVLVFIYFS